MSNPTWNLTDQDCDAFDNNWTSYTGGNATLTTSTEDSRTVYKYVVPDDTSYAYAYNSSLSSWTECTAEAIFKFDPTNCPDSNYVTCQFYLRDSSKYGYSTWIFYYPGQSTYWYVKCVCGVDSSATVLRQWIDITENDWHTIRMVVNSSHKLWVWFDGQFIGQLNYGGSTSTNTANTIGFELWQSYSSSTIYSYLDHIRASSTKAEPDNHGLIKIQGASSNGINVRVRSLGSGGTGMPSDPVNPADSISLRLADRYVTDIIYGIPLVSTSDTYASNIRVYDGTEVKALQRLPTSSDF